MGKLGYKKSKKGCQKCKSRRVKCDEKVPCSACRKHGVPCSLQYPTRSTTSPPGDSLEPADPPRRKSKRATGQRHPSEAASSDCLPLLTKAYPSTLPPISSDPWIQDLELMHHYTSSTHATFPTSPSAFLVFKEVIPQVSFRFPYLLHQVLAISAFHLAHLHPSQRKAYRFLAAQHQTKSISGMREALSGEFTTENAYALFSTSAFLMGSVFASQMEEYTCPLDGMLEIVSLLKGTMTIQKQALGLLNGNPAGNLGGFKAGEDVRTTPLLRECAVHLRKVKDDILGHEPLDDVVRKTIVAATDDMLRAMENPGGPQIVPTKELKVVFMWPAQVSDDYLGLLGERHPAALTVFLFYCVMLRSMEDRCWLLKGWGPSLTAMISKLLVESPWVEWKAWPVARIEEAPEKGPV